MIRIRYPKDPVEQIKFESTYIAYLAINKTKESVINTLLCKVSFNSEQLNLRVLLTAPFDALYKIYDLLLIKLDVNERKKLSAYLDYTAVQPRIANFFMQQTWINIETCYYCNIDNIYSFTDMGDYLDPLDFVNKANIDELQQIEGIGPVTADNIIEKRITTSYANLDGVPVGKVIKERIRKFQFKNSHNHFTLDHYYHKDKYSFLSLCLYNFVPSCYSCNSKFKKTIEIADFKVSKFISPTSVIYGLDASFSFKLRLHKPLNEITDLDHFSLSCGTEEKEDLYHGFLKTFKILGRYKYYKKEALRLIKKKLDYPQTQIDEIVRISGRSDEEVKKSLFGEELFEDELSQKSLVKFKRDIARELLIDGVIS